MHLGEQPWKKGDPDPKALAYYGALWQDGLLSAKQAAEQVCSYLGVLVNHISLFPKRLRDSVLGVSTAVRVSVLFPKQEFPTDPPMIALTRGIGSGLGCGEMLDLSAKEGAAGNCSCSPLYLRGVSATCILSQRY